MIYYVSSTDGSYVGNGTSSNSPISIDVLNDIKLQDGDAVLFKRGDIFYDSLEYKKDKNSRVLFDSYGNGEEPPTFSCCRIIEELNNLVLDSTNIYSIDLTDNTKYKGTRDTTNANNVGFILYNDVVYGDRKETKTELSKDFDFYCDDKVYIYLSGNLENISDSICFVCEPKKPFLLQSNTTIQNIKFQYIGGHALVGNSNPQNILVQNNIFNFIGGSRLLSHPTYIRYGNAIEFFGYGKNIVIRNNKIENCYDVGFTLQGRDGYWEHVDVYGNTFKRNSQSFEVWGMVDQSEVGSDLGFKNVKFHNNVCIEQGRGWGYIRKDKNKSCDIEIQNMELLNNDIIISNNIFYNPLRYVYVYTNSIDVYIDKIRQSNNKIYLRDTSPVLNDEYYINDFDVYRTFYSKDDNSKIMVINNNTLDSIYEKISVLTDEMNLTRNSQFITNYNIDKDIMIYNPDSLNYGYMLISEFNLTTNYERKDLILFYSLIYDSSSFDDMGIIKLRAVTDDGKHPTIFLSTQNGEHNKIIDDRNFIIYYKTDQEGVTNVKLYYKVNKAYASLMVKQVFTNGINLKYPIFEEPPTSTHTVVTSERINRNIHTTVRNNTTIGYVKICSVNVGNKYDYCVFKLSCMELLKSSINQCDLYVKVKQEKALPTQPIIKLLCKNSNEESGSSSILANSNFAAKITTVDPTKGHTVDIYYKFQEDHCQLQFQMDQYMTSNDAKVTLADNGQPILTTTPSDLISCD